MSAGADWSPLATPEPWMDAAVCASVPDDTIWYPEKGGSTRTAKMICGGCPVAVECLTYALTNGEKHGVWGGASERERHRMPSPRTAHAANWVRGEYPCEKCQRMFVTRHGLRMHERTHLAAA